MTDPIDTYPDGDRPGTPGAPDPQATVPQVVDGAAGTEPAGTAGPTGHPRVDAALELLQDSAGLPPAEQIAAYDEVHRTLQETLATIDEGRS
jgi:hypothetical protein